MIILHLAPVCWDQIGGLHVSIPALVAAQNRLPGVEAGLVVTSATQAARRPPEFPVFDRKGLRCGDGRLNLAPPFDRPDVAVFHSTYIPAHAVIAGRLRKASIPYIVCPRGGMTRYAQRYRRWKKLAGNLVFFRRIVEKAAAVHCLTAGEAAASGAWRRPIFVAGNGVHVPGPSQLATPGRSPHRRLVFLGRLHVEYKGLDMLLDACQLAAAELRRRGAAVELRGPDCAGSFGRLAARIARGRLGDVVALGGPVVGEAKAGLLRRADVFLHPSRSEGHPVAVLEALAHGLPCLLTPVTNMAEEVAAAGAGWKVEASAGAIAAGLKRVLREEAPALEQAGERARRLAVEQYRWETIAARTVEAYRRCAA